MSTLVIRFSSLGDIVLTGGVTGALGDVEFLTRAHFAPIAEALPGVRRVHVWEQGLPRGDFEAVVDLHGSPRSRLVCARLGLPTRRIRRYDLQRRLKVAFKTGAAVPSVLERYAEAAGVIATGPPWITGTAEGRDTLVLCPCASHATKRWAPGRFAALGARWDGPVAVLGGPDERAVVNQIALSIGARAEGIAETGFRRTFAALARGRVAVAGDTGLLHLAAAMGLPVVGLFGPTTSTDGFWDRVAKPLGEVIELSLDCRPCSLHGGESCPIGDHACLDRLTVEQVWAAVERAKR